MQRPEPFVREAGSGPAVACLHSNASSSAQWRALMERLAPRFRVLAPDAYGSGKSPDWPSPRTVEVLEFAQLGHMGPITDPEPVNEAIAAFLERTA